MLETFVFISGYIYSFQFFELKKNISFTKLVKKKSKRLLLPYFIFGIIYVLLFESYEESLYVNICIRFLNGIGHLWFLPMLFWCFIGLWILTAIRINDVSRILILMAFAICSPIGFGFQIGSAMYYILFFFIGWLGYKYREMVDKLATPYTILILALVYVISFVLMSHGIGILKETTEILPNIPLLSKVSIMGNMRMLRISYSLLGVSLYYLIALWFVKSHKLSPLYVQIGSLCFGVYIF